MLFLSREHKRDNLVVLLWIDGMYSSIVWRCQDFQIIIFYDIHEKIIILLFVVPYNIHLSGYNIDEQITIKRVRFHCIAV